MKEKSNLIKIEKIFVIVAIFIGSMYMIFLLPTYVPDEDAHIYRAYSIAKGDFIIKNQNRNRRYICFRRSCEK